MKRWIIVLFAMLIVSGVLVSWAAKPATSEGAKPYTPTRIEWLVVELQSFAAMDQAPNDRFRVGYYPLPEKNAVRIVAAYVKPVDRQNMEDAIEYARRSVLATARRHGWEKWVKVQVKRSALR